MTALNAAAKAALRDAGVTQADWARAWFPCNARPGDLSTEIGRPVWLGDACGCPDDRSGGYHHESSDDCGCLDVLLSRYLTERAARGARVSGPYETERAAASEPAVRAAYDAAHNSPRPGVMTEHNTRMLSDACAAAGVDLGAYDRRILTWLAGYEPQMCAVIAGLISRARAAGGAR